MNNNMFRCFNCGKPQNELFFGPGDGLYCRKCFNKIVHLSKKEQEKEKQDANK